MSIDIVIYSYKNKNLPTVVNSIIENSTQDIKIYLYDQNNIDRKDKFLDHRIKYSHVSWDSLDSPCSYKDGAICDSIAEYVAIISDDIMVSPGWDSELITFLKNKKVVVSGKGFVKLFQKDIFTLSTNSDESKDFSLSQYIDRNFIFFKRSTLEQVKYPYFLKYFGENEYLSMGIFTNNIDIYSAPSYLYTDLNKRTIENLYTPYSKEHKYTEIVKKIIKKDGEFLENTKRPLDGFLTFHGIDVSKLKELPYANDDIKYHPDRLSFQDLDARKFISLPNQIS